MKKILKSIIRNKISSGVILISLVMGMACINLITIFINRELNTDNFHTKINQIYTLQCDDPFNDVRISSCISGSAEYMKANFPSIEDYCRIRKGGSRKIFANHEAYFDQPKIIAGSSNLFDFFSYELLTNNPKTVLEADNNLVISDVLAKKYFGNNSPMGQFITIFNRDKEEQMVVTGIFRKPHINTQINFDMVRPIGEKYKYSYCYLRLNENEIPGNLEKLFEENQKLIPSIPVENAGSYYLKPFRDNYFDSSENSGLTSNRAKTDLWIALIIGLMIIGVASFNYIGLTNNKLLEKSKEYAIRRVNGGSKFSLLCNFMSESMVIICISFMLSLPLMLWMAPFFNELVGTQITKEFLFQTDKILLLLGIVVFLIFITLLFALYQIGSRVKTNSLKPSQQQTHKQIQLPVFNIFQIATSVILIICSIIILKQIEFISNKPIGLDKTVLEVKIPGQYSGLSAIFKDELKKNASIDKISVANASPVLQHMMVLVKYQQDGVEKQYSPSIFEGDENYCNTLGIQVLDGSGFSGNPLADKNKCLINESMAQLFPEINLIGKEVPGMEDKIVIGIVKDFHYSNLKSLVHPGLITYKNKGSHLMVKPVKEHQEQTKQAIAQVWNTLIPNYPVTIESIGDRYEWLHRENKNYIKLLGACCLISILLSMIGLFANSYQTSRCRTKEIGIRKVNGAKTHEIIAMLNKGFAKWVAIAFVIACPIAWYAMSKWLENFAYKTELSWWIFALAGLIALGITLLTVSFQSWRVATRNPVESLRYE